MAPGHPLDLLAPQGPGFLEVPGPGLLKALLLEAPDSSRLKALDSSRPWTPQGPVFLKAQSPGLLKALLPKALDTSRLKALGSARPWIPQGPHSSRPWTLQIFGPFKALDSNKL